MEQENHAQEEGLLPDEFIEFYTELYRDLEDLEYMIKNQMFRSPDEKEELEDKVDNYNETMLYVSTLIWSKVLAS